MTWRAGTSAYQTLPFAMDPLADWIRPERERGKCHRVLVLIRLAAGCDLAALDSFRKAKDPDRLFVFNGLPVTLSQWQQALGIIRPAGHTLAASRYLTANVAPVLFDWLLAEPLVQALFSEMTLCQTLTMREGSAAEPHLGAAASCVPAGTDVLTGIIDYGFPVAGPVFAWPDGSQGWKTRLCALWVQDGKPNSSDPDLGLATPGLYKYGAVITGAAVEAILTQCDGDEDAFYQRSGLFRPLETSSYWTQAWASHGAHVSGLALGISDAGNPVVAVHMPKRTVEDSSGAALTGHAYNAMRFILQQAEAIGAPDPSPLFVLEGRDIPEDKPRKKPDVPAVVINLSYGFNAGPHDGSGPLEKAMAELQSLWNKAHPESPLIIVVPAGNAFQSQTFARFDAASLSKPDTSHLIWEVPPDDASANSVQIWLPVGYAGTATMTLTAPDGRRIRLSNQEGCIVELPGATAGCAAMAVFCGQRESRPRGMFQLVVGPTQTDLPHRAGSGYWRIDVEATDLGKGKAIEAWVQRDDLPTADYRPSRQSRFQQPEFRPYDPPAQPGDGTRENPPLVRPGTMNAMATGPATLVVGATFARQTYPVPVSIYSGGGRADWPVNVDGLASSDDSPILWGCLSSGMRAATTVRMFGTSMAAAMATQAVVASIDRFRKQPMKQAFAGMLIDPPHPAPDPRAGHGRLPMP